MQQETFGPALTAAIMAPPATPEQVSATLRAKEKWRDELVKLAAEFMSLDTRPILVTEGHIIERIGPDPVPSELRQMLTDAFVEVAILQQRFAEARAYYRR